jgi:hypothetical protein
MGDRKAFGWHDNKALVWTWPLSLAVSGVALAVLAADGLLWAAGSTQPGSDLFVGLAIAGGIGLFVAVSGRLTSANRLHYLNATFPAVPPAGLTPVARGERWRRSTGRRSGTAYFWMVLTAGGLATPALLNWGGQPRSISALELVLAACCVAGCHLAGPAARFVVTPEHLHICTALRRISVPRNRIARFERGHLTLTLFLDDGGRRDIRVDSPLCDMGIQSYRTNIRAQLRTAERITAMLREVAAAPGAGGPVVVTSRPGMLALAIGSAGVALAAIVAFVFAVQAT